MKNKKPLIGTIFFIIIAFSAARLFQNTGGIGTGYYVARVTDGDTIELSSGENVRYIGIDAPEIRERDGAEWRYAPRPYAEAAKRFNAKLVTGRKIRLEFDAQKMDKYGRLLAYVYTDGAMVNLEMVREGYATIYTFPPNVKYVEEFMDAQEEARKNKKGLWGDLEDNVIFPSSAGENLGLVKMVEAEVMSTYLSAHMLILNCRDNFKVVIFSNNMKYLPKEAIRSPEAYFKHKTIRVHGVIKEYKNSYEIIINDPSQLAVL